MVAKEQLYKGEIVTIAITLGAVLRELDNLHGGKPVMRQGLVELSERPMEEHPKEEERMQAMARFILDAYDRIEKEVKHLS